MDRLERVLKRALRCLARIMREQCCCPRDYTPAGCSVQPQCDWVEAEDRCGFDGSDKTVTDCWVEWAVWQAEIAKDEEECDKYQCALRCLAKVMRAQHYVCPRDYMPEGWPMQRECDWLEEEHRWGCDAAERKIAECWYKWAIWCAETADKRDEEELQG